MGKNFYDLLELPRTASADEIKAAFRREIAKYHPDKVQHLGQEFQDIAVSRAADLTSAYKTLGNAELRAEYDASLDASPATPPQPAAAGESGHGHAAAAAPAGGAPGSADGASVFAHERAGATDVIRRAAVGRLRQAIEREFGRCEPLAIGGFEVACAPPKAGLFGKTPPAVLARYVGQVSGAAVTETWGLAARARSEKRDVCVFLMGPAWSPAGELATAISEQRRRPAPAAGKLIVVPLNTSTWQAHVPTDAPAVVKSLLARTQSS